MPTGHQIEDGWFSSGTRGSIGEEVFAFRLSDSLEVRLTTDDDEDRSPAWSPQAT
jgi:hypothetical protein